MPQSKQRMLLEKEIIEDSINGGSLGLADSPMSNIIFLKIFEESSYYLLNIFPDY